MNGRNADNEVEPRQDWVPDKGKADIREESSMLRSIASKKMERVSRTAAINEAALPRPPAGTKAAVDNKDKILLDLGNMATVGNA